MTLLILLAAITIVAGTAQYLAFRRLYLYVERELNCPAGNYCPPVSVILPCKGLDAGFADNIRKLLRQNYAGESGHRNFEVVFAVASADDPAYAVLESVRQEFPQIHTSLVVAGINTSRAQKINNQLTALQHIDANSEVIVFVDSDVIARDDFLSRLVGPLAQNGVGATTGYRFYIPYRGDWPSLLRAMWNRMSAWEMAHPSSAFAWGGAMAIRKEIFDRAEITRHWDRSADDDLALTTAVKELGLSVRFVPQCLVATDGDGSLGEIVEWTNRQLILTKVYYPQLWFKAIQRALLLMLWLVAMACAVVMALMGDQSGIMAVAAGLSIFVVEVLFIFKAQNLWRTVLAGALSDADRCAAVALQGHESGTESSAGAGNEGVRKGAGMRQSFESSAFRFCLMLPLAHVLLPWLTLYSLVTNRIKWRGVSYELRSRDEIVVCG